MLAVPYKTNVDYYARNGLVIRAELGNADSIQSKVTKTRLNISDKSGPLSLVLSLAAQAELHAWLDKITKRHNGTVPNPERIATLLLRRPVTVSIPQKQTATTKFKRVAKTHQVFTNEVDDAVATLDDSERALPAYIELANMTKRLYGVGTFMIIGIASDSFRMRLPVYMQQLLPHITKLSAYYMIPEINDAVSLSDPVARVMFRTHLIVRTLDKPNMQLTDIVKRVIVNETGLPDERIRKLWSIPNLLIYTPPHATLTFDKHIKVLTNIPIDSAKLLKGTTYLDNYRNLIMRSRCDSSYLVPLHSESIITGVSPARALLTRPIVKGVLNKIDTQIRTDKQSKVIIVMVANKGSGKTGVVEELLPIWRERYSMEFGHLTSDAYGRWKAHYMVKKGLQATDIGIDLDDSVILELQSKMTYANVKALDTDEFDSCYEIYAAQLLDSANISDIHSYQSLSIRKQTELIAAVTTYLQQNLDADAKLGEAAFYARVTTSIDAPRVILVEGHSVTQTPVLGRSDITFILDTINDGYTAVIERNRNGPVDVLLFDTYSFLISGVYTKIFPYELVSQT